MTRLHSAREEEGTRIAREVHDELGQAMTGLKLDLSWVARRLSLPETANSRAQDARAYPGDHATAGRNHSSGARDCDGIASERTGGTWPRGGSRLADT